MILLTSGSLTPVKRIDPVEMELSLQERDSTASFSVESTDRISVNSWMKDDVPGPGSGIIWRVKGIRQNFGNGFPEIDLEHIICTLKDRILFGEITPATITGNPDATTCTAQQAVSYILSQQSDWTLGTFSFGSVTSAYRFDGDNLFDALKKVSDTFNEPWWSYDLSVYPFRLNITAKPSGVGCELRAGRNLQTISRTVDKTGMYTRFYPIGRDDLHVTGDYVSLNESTYGVIAKVETDQSIDTEAGLTAWANERLSKHAQPRVNITINGLDLADATGETLDSLTLGRICRVPLPEYNTTIEERITELSYPDKLNKPESVTVTLSNEKDDRTTFAALISNEIKTGAGPSGSGARGGARQQKEDHAWLEDNTDSIGMVVGLYDGNKFIKAGEISLAINATTGESLATINATHVNVSATNTVQTLAGAMEMDANGNLVIKEGAGLYLEHTQQGSVAKFGVWDQGNLTGGIMVQQINGQSGTVLTLSADVIDIQGIVDSLTAFDIEVNDLTANDIWVENDLSANMLTIRDAFEFGSGNYVSWQSQSVITSVGTTSFTKNFRLADGTAWDHTVVTDVSKNSTTIYYLGSSNAPS